ncbi:SPOR domain-containing protein [Sphingobacterium corticibacterium]|uniref:SPOR domain-containing protein n=1 Tax=Sphingobacterium corticibacterium TaxID=2484746 RepID=A0A4Q6XTY3_9SPHI|nr:SPOR domain-containing protein [Sphingobacterium corticibacterium]RZF60279.1 SPOR domain-containing protein [Sphingobacterium corticibacterium]
MLYKGLIFGFVLLGFAQLSKAQSGIVEVEKDSLINLLQEFRAENGINPTTARMVSLGSKVVDKKSGKRVKVRGFRVQVFSGANRSDAYAVQARFQRSYKDIGAYVTYDEPNYRVKVGDFRSRSEATSFMQELRSQYSNVFVFTEEVWAYE